jgi:hypothetical protein
MARSTFEGPVLAGDNRFGPLRNVGYMQLVQDTNVVLTNATNATAGYGGISGQFVNGNGIPNVNATVYTPSSSVYPPTAATITADTVSTTTGTLYRGIVMYVPFGSTINDILIDTNVAITLSAGTAGTVTGKIGNNFDTTTYGSITTMNAATGRNTVAQTGAQLLSCQSTTGDVLYSPAQGSGPNSNILSQVVLTITIPYTGGTSGVLSTFTAGTFSMAVRYTQLDGNIGTSTTYPYGNFD